MIATTARRRRKPVAMPTPAAPVEPKPYVPSKEFANYPPPHCEAGPVGMIWREDERYPTWALPVHTITYTPRRAYTPRVTPNF